MADSELRRTHPATVVIRTVSALGQAVGAVVAVTVFGSLGGRGGLVGALGLSGLIILVVSATVAAQWVRWSFFRYAIIGDDLLIHEGWLVRKRRSIPLPRVQGVDIRAGVLMRLLGMADVVVQTAGGGGGDPEAKIGAVTLSEAERLRFELLHRRGDVREAGVERTIGPDPVGRMSDLRGVFGGVESAVVKPSFEYRIGVTRLAVAAVTSRNIPLFMAAALGAAPQLLDFGGLSFEGATRTAAAWGVAGLVIGGILLFLIVGLSAVAVTVARDYGFTVRRVADRIETEAGLFERRMTGLPVSRIQTVSVEQSPLRRVFGFTAVQVVTAGFGRGEEQKTTTAASIVPLVPARELDRLMQVLLPEASDFPETHALPERALRFYVLLPTATVALVTVAASAVIVTLSAPGALVIGLAGVLTAALVAAWRAGTWMQTSYGVDERAFALRHGILGRYGVRIPRSRIQSLTVRQNPFQRRAGLATLVIATVSGSSSALYRVSHMDHADSVRLARWYSDRPRVTRVTRTTDQG